MLTLEYLAQLAQSHPQALAARVREFSIDGETFRFNSEPAIMGVINLSPDSWYRESVCLTPDQAVARGRVLRAQGARLVDVGAESTLGHAARLGGAEQKNKLLPVVRGLAAEKIIVSVETYQPAVARACLEAGARVLNFTGTEKAGEVFRMAARHAAAVIICHVQGRHARAVGDFSFAADPAAALRDYFARRTGLAARNGVEKIVIDPGLGFYYPNLQDSAGRVRHQMRVFLNTFRLRALGFPVCHALPHAFACFGEEVRSAEPFFAVLAALGGTDLFRTHEVPRVKAVLETLKTFPT
ncbi:MAG: dihydropteroate synthase [Verrucomicrobiota bacterium]|jgi:dihydropteroate synthase